MYIGWGWDIPTVIDVCIYQLLTSTLFYTLPGRSGGEWWGGLIRWMDGWMIGWMIGWLDGRMVGWLDGWMVGWLDGWMVGWLDDRMASKVF